MALPIDLPPRYLEKVRTLGIQAQDIAEAFVRGSGKGGQKINKTASCVWLRHLPTGLEVKCQKHREQSKNRTSAYKLLILKIEEKVKGAASERARTRFRLKKQKQRRSRRSKEKMLEEKRRRSEVKSFRKTIFP